MQNRRGEPGLDERPVHRLLALVASDLTLAGDPRRGAAPVHGLDLEVEAGTLVILTPPDRGRTVILHLSGQLTEGPERAPGVGAARQCVIVPAAPDDAPTVQQLLDRGGPRAAAIARRLGLGGVLSEPLAGLDAGQQMRVRLASASAQSPDLVALDEPTLGLDDQAAVDVLSAVRDLVDTDGRTAVVICDPDRVPAAARRLADRVVTIATSPGRPGLLASRP